MSFDKKNSFQKLPANKKVRQLLKNIQLHVGSVLK